MIKKMNNKGYMLVEIILAFAITFALVYFMMNLVIEMKNKNDDLLVKTIVTTDQTIITNELMEYAVLEEENFDCSQLEIDGKSVAYKGKIINVVSDYVDVGTISCNNNTNKITINIPMSVKQMSDFVFDASVDYRYGPMDTEVPTCTLSVSGTTISASYSDLNSDGSEGSGIKYYGWNSLYEGENSDSKIIDSIGDYTFYVVDNAMNVVSCNLLVEDVITGYTCKKNAYSNPYDCNYNPSVRTYSSNNLCSNACSGVCVAEECLYCPNGGSYSGGICEKTCTSYYCDSGWTKSGSVCRLYNQSQCTSGSVESTSYSCSTDFNKTSDDKYCYKIENNIVS